MRVEERRNQRHRGHDAHPLRSLETPASVTLVEQRLREDAEEEKQWRGKPNSQKWKD